MENIDNTKKAVEIVLKSIYEISPSDDEVETQLIIDHERGHYLLYSVGWENTHWVYGSFVHIDVRPDGKVWLQHDGTDLRVAEMMAEAGIPKKSIVIGFQPPHARMFMPEYAAG